MTRSSDGERGANADVDQNANTNANTNTNADVDLAVGADGDVTVGETPDTGRRSGAASPGEGGRDPLTVARALVAMSRPDQLLLMAAVYAAGLAAAVERGAPFGVERAVVGFLVFLPVAASVHYANEYADYGTDLLTERTPFSGGSGALARTGLSRRLPLRAAVVTLTLGTVAAAGAVATGRLSPSAVGVLGVIAVLGWQYSVGPLALAWRGWGELDNAFLGGIALPVYGVAVAAGSVRPWAVLAFVPFGCVVFVNLLATTWPDRRADAAVGKDTLATRLEPRTLRGLYAGGALAAVGTMALVHGGPVPAAVCVATAVPLAGLVVGWTRYTRQRSPFPTVATMVGVGLVQAAVWGWLAVGT
jgi:1,4-dihydroxy-2-naphthoate octaprenyltransferase